MPSDYADSTRHPRGPKHTGPLFFYRLSGSIRRILIIRINIIRIIRILGK